MSDTTETRHSVDSNIFEALDEAETEQMKEVNELLDEMDEMEEVRRIQEIVEEHECLHEKLEESRPPNHKGEPHMLACPCPKCTPRC